MLNIKLFFLVIFQFFFQNFLYADTIAFIDIEKLINESNIGKLNIKEINKQEKQSIDLFKKREENLRKEEQKLIAQKNILSLEEYNKISKEFQNKVNKYNFEKKDNLNSLKNKSFNFKINLMKVANPIIADYAEKNSYSMIIQKRNTIMAKKELDITKDIIQIMDNSKVKINQN